MSRNNYFNYETPSSVMDLNGLQDLLVSLSIGITGIILVDSILHVRSTTELTVEQKTIVDSTISSFTDTNPDDKVPKIMDMVKDSSKGKHFHDIDYIREIKSGLSLIPKRTITQGEVTKVDWYKTLDAQMNPTDLVISVDIKYNRDATGFATSRTTTRTWINRDESENQEKKITSKYYFVNPSDMITEGFKRRKLLVSSIQIPVMTFMSEVLMPSGYTQEAVVLKGREFLDDYEQDFSKFIENSSTITNPADPNFGKKTVIVQLEDNAVDGRNKNYNLWLDDTPPSLGGLTTIRQYIISEFNI